MPVIINDCDESVESDDIPIILAQFQFGPLLDIIAETHTHNIHIEYAEFMQMMYSRTGNFVFRPSTHKAYNLLLLEYERNHSITCYTKTDFAREDRPLNMSNLLVSRDLHNLINGPFTAVVDIIIMSSVLQFGIKQRIVFSVSSAPYIPALKLCNNHIYQIVIGGEHCTC